MKIGILTQPLHRNYGGILQNWALQQVLKDMGHEPEMIFREYNAPKRSISLIVKRCLSWGKCLIKRYLFRQQTVFVHSPFARIYDTTRPRFADRGFIKKISRTRELFDDRELRKEISRHNFEAFIVGSDQVWREEYSPRIETYFLDFLADDDSRPRIAYAASLGKDQDYISKEKLPACQKLIKKFNAVSVREYGAITALKRDFNYDFAVKVLDPTLLLTAEDYRAVIKDKDRNGRPHIAAYILDNNDDKNAILEDCAKTLSLAVDKFSGEYDGKPMLTVSQWLANFDTADFVVTDSFHGCVFSIIFHKPFIAIANKERGLDRFISLLHDAGLEDRLVFSCNDFFKRKDGLLQHIDYNQIEKSLQKKRRDSFRFLDSGLHPDLPRMD